MDVFSKPYLYRTNQGCNTRQQTANSKQQTATLVIAPYLFFSALITTKPFESGVGTIRLP